jgi:ureidoglycolate hydrolase
MRKIKVEPLTREAFAPFGEYYAMTAPEGYSLNGELHRFFPDRLTESYNNRLAFSPILVKKPEKMLITQLEYHTTTPEMILPLNGDMIIHVAPASNGTPVTDFTRAFLVKQGTLVKIRSAIWHLAPLPAEVEELSAMIILPECTYCNDCKVVDLKEEEQFLIEK